MEETDHESLNPYILYRTPWLLLANLTHLELCCTIRRATWPIAHRWVCTDKS